MAFDPANRPTLKPSDIARLLAHLAYGKRHAITSADLRHLTGVPEATQRAIFHEIDGSDQIVNGERMTILIGSGQEGYWLCESYEEAMSTTGHMRSRRRELDERIARRDRAIGQAFPDGPIQRSLFH